MSSVVTRPPASVVIAGGGFAGVEAMLALRALAGEQTRVTLVSPDPVLHYRPAVTLEISGSVHPQGYDLNTMALNVGARYLRDGLDVVLPTAHQVLTSTGTRLGYDVLILAMGARAVGGVPGASVFRDQRDLPMIRRLFEGLDRGTVRSVAFVVPPGRSWPLPAYELALLAATRMRRGHPELEVSLVSSEVTPLEAFGPRSSRHIAELLSERGVRFIGNTVPAAVRRDGTLELAFAGAIRADRVVAIPALRGRRMSGVPASWWGFVPVDAAGRVEGLSDVYAAGDMTTFPVKNGGLATQEADRIAHGVAASLGVPVREPRESHVLQAVLVGADRPILLRTELDSRGEPTVATLEHIDHPGPRRPTKVFGRYLNAYLEALDVMAA